MLSLLVGGAALVFQHRETRVCDDQAAGDLQGGQVEAEETHDERAADSKNREDRKDIDAGLPRLGAHRRRVVGGGQAREGGEASDRVGDRSERQDRR